ncbi:MAG: hypothetical protein HOQ22_00655 [Nocardioidaceae bacterium]|nr:hypothetical protein [Nocardioidaceae bacterium]
MIHGDLGGKVLRAGGLPGAVIDWPPYHRPAGFALAIVAGDAVAWEGAPSSLLDDWADVPHWHQLLVRALVCRIPPGAATRRSATRPPTPSRRTSRRVGPPWSWCWAGSERVARCRRCPTPSAR